jgi:hypothetical protein
LRLLIPSDFDMAGREGVAESCFNFLHMEMVQMALGASASATIISNTDFLRAGRQLDATGWQAPQALLSAASPPPATAGIAASRAHHAPCSPPQVGYRLAQRCTHDRPRFTDTLEIIKFICKDFWFEVLDLLISCRIITSFSPHPLAMSPQQLPCEL